MIENIKKRLARKCQTEEYCETCVMKQACRLLEDALACINQLEQERDALLVDLKKADMLDCQMCANNKQMCECAMDCDECAEKCECHYCRNNSRYVWRGLCEENSGEKPV